MLAHPITPVAHRCRVISPPLSCHLSAGVAQRRRASTATSRTLCDDVSPRARARRAARPSIEWTRHPPERPSTRMQVHYSALGAPTRRPRDTGSPNALALSARLLWPCIVRQLVTYKRPHDTLCLWLPALLHCLHAPLRSERGGPPRGDPSGGRSSARHTAHALVAAAPRQARGGRRRRPMAEGGVARPTRTRLSAPQRIEHLGPAFFFLPPRGVAAADAVPLRISRTSS